MQKIVAFKSNTEETKAETKQSQIFVRYNAKITPISNSVIYILLYLFLYFFIYSYLYKTRIAIKVLMTTFDISKNLGSPKISTLLSHFIRYINI